MFQCTQRTSCLIEPVISQFRNKPWLKLAISVRKAMFNLYIRKFLCTEITHKNYYTLIKINVCTKLHFGLTDYVTT